MQITKKYQKLIPHGVEAKFNCQSKKGLKVTITRNFETFFEADSWFMKREFYLRNALRNLEVLCNNARLKK